MTTSNPYLLNSDKILKGKTPLSFLKITILCGNLGNFQNNVEAKLLDSEC